MHKAGLILILMLIVFGGSILITSCSNPNSEAKYEKEAGVSSNCRALIQESVNSWRNGVSSAEDAMYVIESRCGANGDLS